VEINETHGDDEMSHMARRNPRSVEEMHRLLADRQAIFVPRSDAEIDAEYGADDGEDRDPPCLSDDELEARSYVERPGQQFIRPGY
jgi:hypothetical protein